MRCLCGCNRYLYLYSSAYQAERSPSCDREAAYDNSSNGIFRYPLPPTTMDDDDGRDDDNQLRILVGACNAAISLLGSDFSSSPRLQSSPTQSAPFRLSLTCLQQTTSSHAVLVLFSSTDQSSSP